MMLPGIFLKHFFKLIGFYRTATELSILFRKKNAKKLFRASHDNGGVVNRHADGPKLALHRASLFQRPRLRFLQRYDIIVFQ